MKISKLRFTSDDCVNNINNICNMSNIYVKRENKQDHIILYLTSSDKREGMIRIYDSSKGRTLDGSQKDRSLNDEVLLEFQDIHCGNDNASIIDKRSVYNIKPDQVTSIEELIQEIAAKNGYGILRDSNVEYTINYRFKVKGEDKSDNITITQFNSGKMLIQGKGWQTWDDICEGIERNLNYSVEEMLVRYMVSDKNETIQNIITSNLVQNANKQIMNRLGSAYCFLYDHDKKLITSSQAQLMAKVDYGDYYCYVAPILKVIEGYLIKMIVDLGLKTETEISAVKGNGKPKFHFGEVFHGDTSLIPSFKNLLKNTGSTVEEKERALLNIYDKYSWRRSPYQHNGIPPIPEVRSYEDAESIFDEIIGMIIKTHRVLTA